MLRLMIDRLFLLLLAATMWQITLNGQPAAQQPNLVLIVADDLGFADVGFNGSTQIVTPHLDQLAKTGVIFTQGYVSSPVCSPSRAGLLTGLNQVEFGHDNNIGGSQPGFDPHYLGLPVQQQTIATRLQRLGYTCALIGKWHLGEAAHFHPLQRGFDEFWGYTRGGHDYFVAEVDGTGYKAPLESNFKTPQTISYLTDDKGDECVDFIGRHADHPFFLFASFNAPHTPMQATAQDLQRYEHIEDLKRRTYAAMVYRLDVNVGKIIAALENRGLRDNTLIVFISDNGGPTDSNASINAPYNGQKGILLEGGIHVPFIINWPQMISEGVRDEPVTALDLAPTFFALAGGVMTDEVKFSGIDLSPYILQSAKPIPDRTMLWRFTISAAIRDGHWKLVRLPDRLPLLFDLRSDRSEQMNVSLKNPKRTAKMLKQLGDWDVQLPHPLFLEGPIWRVRQLSLYDKEYQLQQPR